MRQAERLSLDQYSPPELSQSPISTVSGVSSLPIGRLPQLDSVALWVNHPAELPVLRFVDLLFDMHAFRSKRDEQRMQVGDAVVDHERCRARSELLRWT